ncbi:hypothetical protein [Kitasatospora sp. NPDC085464]|uniref:hypothetical protein n=1 Tax=Kitasatospora sp. NPDC085464 TaxID=3364063 RepID=UPI0037CB6654
MVLAANGVRADGQHILDRIGVDRDHPEFGHSGPKSGDPYVAFVGDPDGSETYGTGSDVHSPPVEPPHVQHGRNKAFAVRAASSSSPASRSSRSSRSWWQDQQQPPGRRIRWRLPYTQVLSCPGTSPQSTQARKPTSSRLTGV